MMEENNPMTTPENIPAEPMPASPEAPAMPEAPVEPAAPETPAA